MIVLLLSGFAAASVYILRGGNSPENRWQNQGPLTVYVYQNPFEVDASKAAESFGNTAQSHSKPLNQAAIILGLPLAAVTGLVAGLCLGHKRKAAKFVQREILRTPSRSEAKLRVRAVVKKCGPSATKLDSWQQEQKGQSSVLNRCQMRFVTAKLSSGRVKQPPTIARNCLKNN